MFGFIDKDKGYLFATHELSNNLRATLQAMMEEVDGLSENRLLNTAPHDLEGYLVEKYGVLPIKLLRGQWYVAHQEVKVDVRHDPRRWIEDRSRPVLIPGERIDVRVPFEGEAELFYARPNSFLSSPPRAIIENRELVLRFDRTSDEANDLRPVIDRALSEIETYLDAQRAMVEAHNSDLPSMAHQTIQQRRARVLARSHRAEALGIPVRQRADAPKTYVVPTVRRKAAPTLPPATTAQFEPEPAWALDMYEHALKVVQGMSLVLERSPNSFKDLDEEGLRTHFLVQLNAQFEGKATGETFNKMGRTDILLREGDRNVFIAECKFWKGPKGFGEAIDQLLGYATWRDGKTAILVFNRGVGTSTVLTGIDETAKAHANFKRAMDWPHESGYRYVFHSPGDRNRELILTVLVFHVPT